MATDVHECQMYFDDFRCLCRHFLILDRFSLCCTTKQIITATLWQQTYYRKTPIIPGMMYARYGMVYHLGIVAILKIVILMLISAMVVPHTLPFSALWSFKYKHRLHKDTIWYDPITLSDLLPSFFLTCASWICLCTPRVHANQYLYGD